MTMSDIEEVTDTTIPPDGSTGSAEPSSGNTEPEPKPKEELQAMAKYTVSNIDYNTRTPLEMGKFMPGCDIYLELTATSVKTLNQCAGIIFASAALGAPFAYVIVGQRIYIDATDKTKLPYSALQIAIGV
jgi:hypothetical protein